MRQINLVLTPAEASTLQAALNGYLFTAREYGLSADELPLYITQLVRVQRLVADGLTYLEPVRPA